MKRDTPSRCQRIPSAKDKGKKDIKRRGNHRQTNKQEAKASYEAQLAIQRLSLCLPPTPQTPDHFAGIHGERSSPEAQGQRHSRQRIPLSPSLRLQVFLGNPASCYRVAVMSPRPCVCVHVGDSAVTLPNRNAAFWQLVQSLAV